MKEEIISIYNEIIQKSLEAPPHMRNLITQINKKNQTKGHSLALEEIIPAYLEFVHKFDVPVKSEGYYIHISESVEKYLNVLKKDECKVFRHQSDFISSVIPELIHRIFSGICEGLDTEFYVSAQKDVIIDCTFDAFNGGRINFKKKKMDVSITIPIKLNFNNIDYDFAIPVVAIEVKTNLDKNMLSGIEQSVESLKKTFPTCLYYNISELADFAIEKQSYATTKVDEIFILRKQKRSQIRGKNAQTIKPIDVDIIKEIIVKITTHLKNLDVPIEKIKDRMNEGKLINKRADNFE